MMRRAVLTAAALGAVAIATPAAASTIYFDGYSYKEYGKGDALSFSGGGVTVSATAWTIFSNGTIDTAKLGLWSEGLGVRSSNDTSHTVDNKGSLDFLVLEFSQAVELEAVRLMTGWNDDQGNYINDTDATIGHLFGAMPLLDGLNMSALNGWDLTNFGEDGDSGDKTRWINPGGNVGNLWLVAASFDNPDLETSKYWCGWKKCEKTTGYDGFKLDYVKFSTPAVPEPSTWLMMILGFGLVGGMLRAKRRENLTVSYS